MRRLKWGLALFAVAGPVLVAANRAPAAIWDASADFSTIANPNGPWTFGSKATLASSPVAYTDTATVPSHYATAQLAGWSDSTLTELPYVLKNTSATDWVYDGTVIGGGIAVLHPGEILVHPYFATPRFTSMRWTAPSTGLYSIDATFQRIERVDLRSSDYYVLLNGVPLAGASGLLTGYTGAPSHGDYSNPGINLNIGDAIEFVVGFGTDATSDTDAVVVHATLQAVPEPLGFPLIAIGSIAWSVGRRLRRRSRIDG